MRKVILISVAIVLYLGAYGLAHWRQLVMREADLKREDDVGQHTQRAWDIGDASQDAVKVDSLPALDAHGFNGIHEISRPELVKLITKFRPLSQGENANLNRSCPGFACLYQGLGLTRWPQLARGTVAYLTLVDALNRRCPNGQKHFVFLKQGW